jgi:TPR repeat protein
LGDTDAMFNLATSYEDGRGVDQDEAEAARL